MCTVSEACTFAYPYIVFYQIWNLNTQKYILTKLLNENNNKFCIFLLQNGKFLP